MIWTEVNAGTNRYVGDFMNDFLPGVWNKKLADTGGSHLLITNSIPYVMVVPNVDLVKSLVQDGIDSNTYPVFGVYGGITEFDFKRHLKTYGEVRKIAVTWDSLYKVMNWINPKEYQVCVDEYHLIFESIGFRLSAINSMMESIKKFKNARFISATPNQEQFEFEVLKKLPHYVINWENTTKIKPIMHKSNNVTVSTCMFINKLLEGELEAPDMCGRVTKVEELYIFLNSVKTIEQICRSLELEPEDVKICCANRKRNKYILDKYAIEDVTSPNKKINFFTSKCFQGCNLYTTNGLVLMVSDTKQPSMLIDMSTQGAQIAGRIRNNSRSKNCFANTLIYIYSTNKNFTPEALAEVYNKTVTEDEAVLAQWNKCDAKMKEWIKGHINEDKDFLIVDGDDIYISEDKKKYAQYQNYLRTTYRNDFTIASSFNHDKFDEAIEQTWNKWSAETAKQLASIKMVTYKTVVMDYFNTGDEEWLDEYPELQEYKKYLSLKECASLHFVKTKMLKRIADIKKSWGVMKKLFKVDTFYPSSTIKTMLAEEYKKEEIDITPTASDIAICPYIESDEKNRKIDGKGTKGYFIKDIYLYSFVS